MIHIWKSQGKIWWACQRNDWTKEMQGWYKEKGRRLRPPPVSSPEKQERPKEGGGAMVKRCRRLRGDTQSPGKKRRNRGVCRQRGSRGSRWTPTREDLAGRSWRDGCARADAEQPKLAWGPGTDSSTCKRPETPQGRTQKPKETRENPGPLRPKEMGCHPGKQHRAHRRQRRPVPLVRAPLHRERSWGRGRPQRLHYKRQREESREPSKSSGPPLYKGRGNS